MSHELQFIHYNEYSPADELRELINAYWVFEYSPDAENVYPHVVLPDGCPSLIFFNSKKDNYTNANIFGPRINQYGVDIQPGTVIVGVRFFPGTIKNILRVNALEIREKNISAYPFFKHSDLHTFAEKIYAGFKNFEKLNNIFIEIIQNEQLNIESDVKYAVKRIIDFQGNLKVTGIASDCGIGIRQLQRKFRQFVGLTLKEFARIRRIRSVLIDIILKNNELHDALFKSGYFDQAHFNRDFSMLSGLNPTIFKKLYSHIKHGNVI